MSITSASLQIRKCTYTEQSNCYRYKLGAFWASQSGLYPEDGLLGCDAVYGGKEVPKVRKNLLSPYLGYMGAAVFFWRIDTYPRNHTVSHVPLVITKSTLPRLQFIGYLIKSKRKLKILTSANVFLFYNKTWIQKECILKQRFWNAGCMSRCV